MCARAELWRPRGSAAAWLFRVLGGCRMAAPESAGCRIEIQLAAVEEHGGSEVRKAPEAIRSLDKRLDHAVDGFVRRARDPVGEIGQHVRQVCLDHASNLLHGFKAAV